MDRFRDRGKDIARRLAPVGVWTAVAVVVVWWARSTPDACPSLRWRAYTAGAPADFDAAVAGCGAIGSGVRTELVLAGVAFVALMVGLVVVLRPLWASSWHAPPFLLWRWVPVLPAVAAAFGAIATVALGIGLETGPLRLPQPFTSVVAAAAWPAAMFGACATIAAGMSVLATIGSRTVAERISDGDRWSAPDPGGSGICVSGGGIRAGAFALGALAYLERHDGCGQPVEPASGLLERADYLASVSGGGYTAGAWRIARGTSAEATPWPSGVFGDLDPDAFDTSPPPGRDFDERSVVGGGNGLFHHMWARREFLRTGRGGLGSTAVMFAATVLLQLVLLAAGVALAAWPLGALAGSWPILGASDAGADPYRFSVRVRSLMPVVSTLGVVGLLAIARSTMMRTRTRLAIDALLGVGVLVAASLAAMLVGLPLLVEMVDDGAGVLGGVASLFAAGGVAVTAWKIASAVLRPAWSRLGGVLLAVAALAFALVVARGAAVPDGVLADVSGWWYVALLAGFLAVWSYSDPRWWSLAPVYRHRLRSAFAVEPVASPSGDTRCRPLGSRDEPTLDEYADAPGPEHLVCCAVARANRTGTGIPALSFVFGPKDVRMYECGTAGIVTHAVPTEAYVRALGAAGDGRMAGGRTRALGTVTAAMAMSGAAVTSAMGRKDAGSTNSLIAGLNVRLGAWVPNPRHVAVADGPAKRARVNYLVKELFGWYDVRDPHVYVTDGGHWDNLGLVELLRRRCETIVCIDASGDRPGSFSALRQALDLARVECRARVDLDAGLATMASDRGGRPATSSCSGSITYLDERGGESGQGRLLFVKAQVSDDLSDRLVGYSFEDPLFPNYPTTDQFLGAEQFRMMVRLGWESTKKGVTSWT